jgi:phosphocarrier protein
MGIHARPAAMIVRVTSQFPDVSVQIVRNGEIADGKSIMEILIMAIAQGTVLDFICEGHEESIDILSQELQILFENNFYE